MTTVLVGAFDNSKPTKKAWCIKCWSKNEAISIDLIYLGDMAADRKCSQCDRRLHETFPAEETNGLRIVLDGEGSWPDLLELDTAGKLAWLTNAPLSISRLPEGMVGGRSSVAIRIDLPDGRTVVAETTMRLFLGCADAFKAAEEKA